MKRFGVVIGVLLFSLLAVFMISSNHQAAEAAAPTGPDDESNARFLMQATGSISGKVTTENNVPIADATVCIQPISGNATGSGCWNVNPADGTFTITDRPAEIYRVEARAPGYAAEIYHELPYFGDWNLATEVTVTAGSNTANINFTLAPGGTITGIVYDAGGSPLGDVYINVAPWNTYGTCSDPVTGAFTLADLPLNTQIYVFAGGNGCGEPQYIRQYWDHKPDFNTATAITLTTGDPTEATTFNLTLGGTITGTVTATVGGAPIENAQVCVQVFPWNEGYGCWNTNASGEYTLWGLPTGDYRVDVRAAGYASELYNDNSYFSDHSQSDPVHVTAGAPSSGINFALDPGGTISGTVMQTGGSTLGGIYIETAPWGNYLYCSNNADGSFLLEGLPLDTDIYLTAGGGGRDWCPGTGYAQEYWQEAANLSGAAPIRLTVANPAKTDVVFTLDQGGTISGRVTTTDGTTALPNAQVCAGTYNEGGNWTCVNVNTDGTYQISGLPSNTYRVDARAPNRELELYPNTPYYGRASQVTVTAGSETPNINFTLARGGSISGRITNADGSLGLGNANICINEYHTNEHIRCYKGGVINYDGTYNFDHLPSGDYRIEMSASGYIREYYNNRPSWEQADFVTVNAPSDTTGINFALDLGGGFTGTVRDRSSNDPVSGGQICVNRISDNMGMGCWDIQSNGTYTVDGLTSGQFSASVRNVPDHANQFYNNKPYYGVNHQYAGDPIDVTIGVITPGINFALDPGGTITGVVRDASNNPLGGISVDTAPWGGYGRCTNADGSFSMEGLPYNTDIKVYAGGPGWGACSNTAYVQQYWDHSPTLDGADAIVLNGANPTLETTFELIQGATITGTVRNAAGTVAIPNAQVWIENFDNGWWVAGVQTNADGTYSISGLPSGTFRVAAQTTGYSMEYFDGKYRSNPDPVTTTAGSTTANINFYLGLGATISGRITDAATNQGLGGIVVNANFDGWGHGTCTNPDGSYTLENIPLGVDFRLQAGGNNNWCGGSNDYQGKYYNNAPNWDEAHVFNLVKATRIQTGINIGLEKVGYISGHVYVQGTSTPIEGAKIFTEWFGILDSPNATTDENGFYRVAVLTSGVFSVRAEAPGYAMEFYNEAGQIWDNATLLTGISGAEIHNINFTLAPGGTISGRVTADGGAPLARVRVGVNDRLYPSVCTDSSGNYTITGVPLDTEVKVFTMGPMWCGGGEGYINKSSAPITLTAGTPDAVNINFELSRAGSISGTVTASNNGVPIAGVWLCAFSYAAPTLNDATIWNCAQTGADGTYLIENVPPEEQRVWIFPENRARLFYNQATRFEDAAAVIVSPGTTTPNINFSLPRVAVISGTIYQADGTTPFGNGVTISTENGEYPECSQPDGTYRIFVPVGSTVKIKAGPGMCDVPGKFFPTQYWDHVADAGNATPLAVSSTTDIPNINFNVVGTGTISGTVTATDTGAALANMPVFIEDTALTACTTADGSYTIEDVPLGTPVLVRSGGDDNACGGATNYHKEWWENVPYPEPSEGYTGAATPITLIGDNPDRTNINFSLDPKGTISGRITGLGGNPLANVRVLAHYDIPHGVVPACTDANGDYTLSGVHPNVNVSVWAGGLNCDGSINQYVRETWDNQVGWITSTTPVVLTPASPSTSGRDFALGVRPVAPSDLTGTVLPSAEIELNWTDNSGDETEFRIERSTNPATGWAIIAFGAVDGTTYTDSAVAYGTTYYYRVTAYRSIDDQSSDPSNTLDIIMAIVPPNLVAPENAKLTNDTTPEFTWSSITGATRYHIHIADNAAFNSPIVNAMVSTTSFISTTALTDGTYYWRVQSRAANPGWSAWSEVRTFTVDATRPPKPVLDGPVSGNTTAEIQPEFTWHVAEVLEHFLIQVDNNEDFSSPEALGETVNPTFTPETGLDDGLYYWRVRAVDDARNLGAWSVVWNLRINAVITSAPTLIEPFNASSTNDTTPEFEWETVADATRYVIQVSSNDTFTDVVLSASQPETIYIPVTELANGQWFWRVRARGTDGAWGDWSVTRSFMVDTVRPGIPTLVTPNGETFTTDELTVAWNAATDAESYYIEISSVADFSSRLIGTHTYNLTFTFGGRSDGVYYWRVRSLDAAFNSSKWSEVRNVRVDAAPAPVPTLVDPEVDEAINDATPTLQWDPVPDARKYRLQVSDIADFSTTVINVVTTQTTYTSLTALADGPWYWQVRELYADGAWSDWSPAGTFTVDTAKPPKPNLLSPTDGSESTAPRPSFTWEELSGEADHFEIQIHTSSVFTGVPIYDAPSAAYEPPSDLLDNVYYWRVRTVDEADNKSGWTTPWSLIVNTAPTQPPTLTSPTDGSVLNNNMPQFVWGSVDRAVRYRVVVSTNLAVPPHFIDRMRTVTTFTPGAAIPDGIWFWHVLAQGPDGEWSAPSAPAAFTIDTAAPAIPGGPFSPTGGASELTTTPTFEWGDAVDADHYEFQIDNTSLFDAPLVLEKLSVSGSTYTLLPAEALTSGKYFWRARAVDYAGNKSAWTAANKFFVTTGPAIMPTPVPTEVVLALAEAEGTMVLQSGSWTTYDSAAASGGRYVYSSGDLADTLSLNFSGTRLDVSYVQHPALGSFAVEVDGMVLQIVNASGPESFPSLTLNLGAGTHTARIYPVGGVIALDGFGTEMLLTPPVPTAEPPTVEPTLEPTLAPTTEPTVEPTLEPTVEPTVAPTLEPTVEPTVVPTLEPTIEPTLEPTLEPTVEPTIEPTAVPTEAPVEPQPTQA